MVACQAGSIFTRRWHWQRGGLGPECRYGDPGVQGQARGGSEESRGPDRVCAAEFEQGSVGGQGGEENWCRGSGGGGQRV